MCRKSKIRCGGLLYLTSFVLVLALAGTNVVFAGIVIERQVNKSSDDMEEEPGGDAEELDSSDLEMPYEDPGTPATDPQMVGLRFEDISIPKGSTISEAWIRFDVDDATDGSNPVSLIIEGELSPDAATFTETNFEMANRPRTAAKVVWVPDDWTTEHVKHFTSNIASVIEEIVSQDGWRFGNALVLIISDDPSNPSEGIRCAESFDGAESNTDRIPLLHIEWLCGPATNPSPDDGQTDVLRDVVLTWKPGPYAAPVNGHKVYLSESFDDVSNDIGGITQSATSYAPGRLDFNTTYYWRVDEVNSPPDYTVLEGKIWSFTTELIAYPIENITATASSTDRESMDPENTINGSGLDANDLHSMEPTDMWLSSDEPLAWIEYELDKVHRLHEMWVWNSNQMIESIVGFGFKDVTIEYSTNGTDYTTLGTTHEFARAPETPDYAYNTTVDFGIAAAKYIRLTANSNWGGIFDQYGLSEVRFFSIPVFARESSPDSGTTDVDVDVTLGWKAGREADKHNVHLSSDEQAVIDGNLPVSTVTETSFGPLSLDLGTTYYWRVDEVNEAETTTTWQGDICNFTTTDHLVVDDFEDYNDYEPDEIWRTWVDGYEDLANGATVGYLDPDWNQGEHYVETAIVHGGKQAMPFFYSNTGGAAYSEGARTFAVPQDWTKQGVTTLGLWFQGTAGNTGQLYVKINDSKIPYDGAAGNLALAGWQPWNIDLTSSGLNLQSVSSLAIGIDGDGASGTLYFDDIRLYALAPAPVREWRISSGSDDAEEAVNTGNSNYNTSSDLELIDDNVDNGGRQFIGLNFRFIVIPPGANIDSAYIEFVCDETKDGTADAYLLIWGHLTPNPDGFETPFVISDRPKTQAKVSWEPEPWTAVGQVSQTADISSIIQELIDQDGWAAGNAIEIIVGEDTSKPAFTGSRCAESYNGSASLAPLLHISYQ